MQNLVNLAELVRTFDLPHLLMLRYKLVDSRCMYKALTGAAVRPLQESDVDFITPIVREVWEFCNKVEFENGVDKAYSMLLRLKHYPVLIDTAWLAIELDNLSEELARDVFKNEFVHVRDELRRYVNQKLPFGKDIAEAFPSSINDLAEAGNCLAVGCNTAAAFHLMRGAEVGLWELGRDRRIPLAQSNKIEFAEWGKIIGELEDAVLAVQQWPNSPTKEDAHKFYNAAVVEIRSFNDGWRRHSAHARPHMPKMESDEAIALWGHVYRFMNKLASKISEGRYTLLVWK